MPFQTQPVKDFIGGGLIFPIQLINGRPPISYGFDIIRASIKTILAFQIGARYYLGEFGSRLDELIEEPNDEILQNLINTFVVDAVTQWEKRVATISTDVFKPDDVSISLNITYQVVNSQTVDNFIYPFYKNIIY